MLAVAQEGAEITTIEGLSDGGLHPVQEAFLEYDAYQCGYCTPGQICSAVGVLDEVEKGWPSYVTDPAGGDVTLGRGARADGRQPVCRGGVYANIVPAVLQAGQAWRP